MRFSIEDLASLTEEEALRRRFDAHNVGLLRRVLWGFLLVAFIQVPVSLDRDPGAQAGLRLGVTLANLAAAALLIVVFRRLARGIDETSRSLLDEGARRVARAPRGAVLAILILEFLLLAAFAFAGTNREPWFFAFPFLFVLFRVSAAESVLLFGSVALTALAETLLAAFLGWRGFGGDFFLALALTLSFALVVSLVVTRRAKRSVLSEWKVERARAQDQIRMRQELELAREVQLGMLPSRDPALPWLDVASVSLPATEVGGDYYGYFNTASGKLAVVVGDVAGHGLASGLVLSGVRSCLTLLAEELDRPSVVMGKLHRMLQTTAKSRMLVTLSIVLFDRERSTVTTASAGHPPLLIRRAATGSVEEELLPALPLGAALQSRFEEREIALAPGDVLVLHTDGIYEAVDAGGATYGLSRLTAVISRQGAEGTASSLRDAVIADLRTFRGAAPQEDDVTLVVMRVIG